jgi:hypothetical protein
MTTLKAIIATLTLLAVAVNPVAASLVPCCCVKQAKPESSCCRTTETAAKAMEAPGVALPACCAQKEVQVDTIVRGGCCCVKAPPAVPAAPDQTKQIIEQPSIEPSCSLVDRLVHAPATRRFEQLPGSLTLTGPPLLALYCIWLK